MTGRIRRDQVDLDTGRAAPAPARFDPSLPVNTVKFEALEKLVALAADIGCSLPELTLGLLVAHPAVTSVISGPRTMEQLEGVLKGAGLVLDDDILDRIDEIMPPGTNTYNVDTA